jgi:hypothetical protein
MKTVFKILILIILINILINIITIYSISISPRLRNLGLRIVVFKEKKIGKILKGFQVLSEMYYNKVLICTANGIHTYNKDFTEDEKLIIETLLSLCY